MPTDERVLVIPTARFRAAGYFHGFHRADETFQAAILDASLFQFRPRSEVETDPDFKQLISYVVLRFRDQLFHYRRGASGTEARLRTLRSIGIGGHIGEEDERGDGEPYRVGMLRELNEEVELQCDWSEQFLGFINDDRTPVGQVHLGVVHLLDLETPHVKPREDALADCGFESLSKLHTAIDDFETWSQFVLIQLLELSPVG